VTGSSFDAIGTIGEFAAGGAVAAFAIRLLIQGLRNLRARVERADPPGATGPGTPPWNDDTAEPSDARVMGEALFGGFLGGWAGAYYVHALAFLKDPRISLWLALVAFAPALWAVMQLGSDPLSGEPGPDDETSVKAWWGFVAALVPLIIAAPKFCR
jgi:hypothetical protein